MTWIIGSMVLILLGTFVMCVFVAGGRIDDRKTNSDRTETNKTIGPSEMQAP